MANVGIMGGTFDPPHFAHLLIAESAYEQADLDYVLFMPGGNPPHKNGNDVTEAYLRFEMLNVAISNNSHFKISDYEVKKQGYSYTVNTLEYLKEKNPDDNLFFILGEDSLAYLDKWYCPEKIVEYANIVVYPRGSNSNLKYEVDRIKKQLGADIKIIDAPVFDISSSKIRDRVKEKKTIRYMTPQGVIDIIEKEKLYDR